jgi:hypothetical protein
MLESFHINLNFSGSVVLENSFLDFPCINTCNCDFPVVVPPDHPLPTPDHDFNKLHSAICPEASM